VDMLEGSSRVGELERRAIHELTGRPPISVDLGEMKELYSGRRIMVTGAGGSIGSELCRQLARFSPSSLVLYERDETNLFYVEQELRTSFPSARVAAVLGDVTAEKDVNEAFDRYRPEIIFHAAAYKHVPILEFHPDVAVRVNVIGTHLLARAAVRVGAECFVYVSTDKAVNPSSVMGASKRLGEMLTTSMNGLGDVRFVAVRFGNVLDTRGSVSTVFREAIRRRQPIHVTDPGMKRYFMLPSEAALLVMQSVALGRGGEVFVLDMGNPVFITDLAEAMIRAAGLVPNVDVPIVFTGARPGEKLFEELLTAEEGTIATANRNILRARISRQNCYPDLLREIQGLERGMTKSSPEELRAEIFRVIRSALPESCALHMEPTASGSYLGLDSLEVSSRILKAESGATS
ncbi:MAG: polysaccharide biosynthesis protein, partial [candidate division WOR-3 bacterium]